MSSPDNIERKEEEQTPLDSKVISVDVARQGRSRWAIKPLVSRTLPCLFSAVLLAEAVAAGYVLDRYGAFDGAKKWIAGRASSTPTETVFPVDQEGKRIDLFDTGLQRIVEKQLDVYNEFQIYSQIQLESLLEKPQPQDTIDTLHKMARNNLISSVNLINTARLTGYIQDRADMDSTYQVIRINSQNYDLNDRFQLQLANAWIQVKLNYLNKKIRLNTGRVLPEDRMWTESLALEDEKEAELLEWFRSISTQINFSEDSFAFFPEWQMEPMARIFRAICNQGFVLPRKVDFCGAKCLEEKKAIGVAYMNQNTTEMENRAGTFVIAHEVAHLVSAQRDLMKQFTEIRNLPGKDTPENRLKYVTEYAMTNPIEDFAETFAQYVINGDQFRFMLEQLRIHKPEEYEVLKKKYDFIKDRVFKGVEFSSKAQVRTLEEERAEEDFNGIQIFPEEGNKVVVSPNPQAYPEKKCHMLFFPY